MASKSMIFRPPLKNFHLFGEALNLRIYSNENHVMQTASTIANWGLSWKLPFSLTCILGMVLSVRAIVDSTINKMDTMAIT